MDEIAAFSAARLAEDWSEARDRELAAGLDESRDTRRVDALRNILAAHAGEHHCHPDPQDPDWVVYEGGQRVVRTYPCGHARAVAAVWSDHPAYDEAWGGDRWSGESVVIAAPWE